MSLVMSDGLLVASKSVVWEVYTYLARLYEWDWRLGVWVPSTF
jgi:hypothetical protein